MGSCTMPGALGFRRWFEDRFDDLCREHDRDYRDRVDRRTADLKLAASIMLRGYPVMSFIVYIFVRLFGHLHYREK